MLRLALIAATTCALAAQNQSPATPTFTEPSTPNSVVNPADLHMETTSFSDPDPGDQHLASTWEVWTVSPSQRVWVADSVTGFEKLHAHLGDGVFENSHAGFARLFEDTPYILRARHRDDSGDPATEWSDWVTIPFSTGAAGIKKAYAAVPLLVVPAATACLFATGPEILALNLLAPWGLYIAYDALGKSPNALAEEARFYDYTQATTCALSAVQFLQVLRDFL